MLSIDTLSVWDAECHEADGSMVFWISRAGDGLDTVTANYSVGSGSAIAGEDYLAQSGVVTFEPGNMLAAVTVALLDDTLTEESEDFYLDLTDAVGATIDRAQAIGMIYGNDHAPVFEPMGAQSAEVDSWFSLTPMVTDVDQPEETLYFSLAGDVPEGASIDPATGEFTWMPGAQHAGQSFTVTIVVTDSGMQSATGTFSIDVSESQGGMAGDEGGAGDGDGGQGGESQNQAPVVIGFNFLTWNEDSMSEPIDVNQAFDDAEDWGEQLTYTVIDSGDPDLVAAVYLDSTGQMTIAGVADAFGFGSITIRCTDTGGKWADAVLSFEILGVDDAPVIESFGARFVDGAWEVFGTVSDVDGSVAGTMVNFGGDLGAYFLAVAVQADGTFVSRQVSTQTISGNIEAQAYDATYLYSNIAQDFIPA